MMSTAINPKRLWGVPDRPLSADPASATMTASPIRQSFSSFSSSISSVFGGRHSRSSSTSTSALNSGQSAPARPASVAPQQHQQKWVPRPVTPGTSNQSRSSRHRSTSSASAAAAALSSSADAPLPPLPSALDSRHRSSPAPPGEGTDSGIPDDWKIKVRKEVYTKYRNRAIAWEHAFATGSINVTPQRRDSLSSGSSASSGDSSSDEKRLRASRREEMLLKLKSEYEEEMRTAIREEARRRGVSPYPLPPIPPAPIRVASRSQRERDRGHGVLVEDELADEWTWRPEEHGQRQADDTRKDQKEMVRQEQQAIWDSSKRVSTPVSQHQQQQPLSSSAGRKVHFAPATPPSSDPTANPNSTLPSATPLSASQSQLPSLPRTPHTAVASGYPARSISAYPSVSSTSSNLSANRPMSPAVTAPGVRPGSARPASPAYTRWIPSTASTGPTSSTASSNGQGVGVRTGSTPIAIPRRSSGTGAGDGNGSASRERPGSLSGSWRDWSSAHGHGPGQFSGARRDTSTPSPTAANGSSVGHTYPQVYTRTASNSNLHSSTQMFATVQIHNRTPSSGNLHASHGRIPSNGNLQSGGGMRRALTPGPVSSASGYARQRTASATHRAPSVPPVLPNVHRDKDKDREYAYGKEYTSLRDREGAKNSTSIVDDRDFDDAPININPVKRVQATGGLGSRTSSNRSALVDEDAPPPEVFSSTPAPALRSSSSRHSRSRRGDADEEDEVRIPKRDKGKGKARAPPSPMLSTTSLPRRRGDGIEGMYKAQLEDFASTLRRDLGISAEA